MSRRTIVPPESVGQHHYVPQSPAQSFNYVRQQPTPPPQRKHIQHDPDVFVEMIIIEKTQQKSDVYFI